eukprot:11410608-Alexandrium_andersonii.AAC.1
MAVVSHSLLPLRLHFDRMWASRLTRALKGAHQGGSPQRRPLQNRRASLPLLLRGPARRSAAGLAAPPVLRDRR